MAPFGLHSFKKKQKQKQNTLAQFLLNQKRSKFYDQRYGLIRLSTCTLQKWFWFHCNKTDRAHFPAVPRERYTQAPCSFFPHLSYVWPQYTSVFQALSSFARFLYSYGLPLSYLKGTTQKEWAIWRTCIIKYCICFSWVLKFLLNCKGTRLLHRLTLEQPYWLLITLSSKFTESHRFNLARWNFFGSSSQQVYPHLSFANARAKRKRHLGLLHATSAGSHYSEHFGLFGLQCSIKALLSFFLPTHFHHACYDTGASILEHAQPKNTHGKKKARFESH